MGRPPRLDIGSLQAKLVQGARGGYCYEQNSLLRAALEALGFHVSGLAARVMWRSRPDEPPRQRSHMLLRIDQGEDVWIADVGFGGLVLTAPLRLEPDLVQKTPHEPFRILDDGESYVLQVQLDGDWAALYSFSLEPQLPIDFEPFNWFVATHPTSPFTYALMGARATAEGRLALSNNRYTRRMKGQEPEERILASVAELRAVLIHDFGVTPPAMIDQLAGRIGLQTVEDGPAPLAETQTGDEESDVSGGAEAGDLRGPPNSGQLRSGR